VSGSHTGRARIRWRTLALPNEHGAWALLLEPIALGSWVLPSAPGAALALAALAAFLAQHPAGMALADLRRARRFPRTRPAIALAVLYGAAAAAAALLTVALGAPRATLVFLAPAVLAAVLQLRLDARNQGRRAGAQLAGAVALAALAGAIPAAGGMPWPACAAFGCAAAARAVPSVLYLRARLRLQRGQPFARGAVFLAHGLALAVVLALAAASRLPWVAPLAFGLLAWRAWQGLRPGAAVLPAARLGVLETAYGVVTVVALAAGSGVWA
jgi:hypothetical protein